MNLDDIRATILDGRTKGIAGTMEPFALRDIGKRGWNVLREDLPLPLMVLKRSALDHNAAMFADYLVTNDLSFAPHGKTTMPADLCRADRHGACALTAATVNQVQVMRAYGVSRIVMANQLLGKAHLAAIAAEMKADPGFDFYCFVDSAAQLGNMLRHMPDKRPSSPPMTSTPTSGSARGRTSRSATSLPRASRTPAPPSTNGGSSRSLTTSTP